MNSTNIITVRRYEDGTVALTINGRDVPDCAIASKQDNGTGNVCLVLGCGTFNDLKGDEAQEFTPNIKLTADTEQWPEFPKQKSWWERTVDRFERWLRGNG